MRKLVQVNAAIGGKNLGDKFYLEFKDGVPIDRFWRRRFNDAKTDNCLVIVDKPKVKKEVAK